MTTAKCIHHLTAKITAQGKKQLELLTKSLGVSQRETIEMAIQELYNRHFNPVSKEERGPQNVDHFSDPSQVETKKC